MTKPSPLPNLGPVTFTVDNASYELPTIPTRDWLDALTLPLPTCWLRLFCDHLPEEQVLRLYRKLTDHADRFDLEDLENVAHMVLSSVTGMDLHVAQRLITSVRADWALFDAWCAEHALDPYTMPISRIVDVAYMLVLRSCEKDADQMREKARLFAPPDTPRITGRAWGDETTGRLDEIEHEAFMAAVSLSR